MKFNHPIAINLLNFIRTGKFDYIKLGQTKAWILNNFPDPDNFPDDYDDPIWRYGNIEFHFNGDELFLIYSDYINTLTGGQSLHLEKWIFDKPKELTLENVARHLARERINYKLEHGTLPIGHTSATIEILTSGVKLGFIPAEIQDENYSQYLSRLKDSDGNLFLLSIINLSST